MANTAYRICIPAPRVLHPILRTSELAEADVQGIGDR